MDSYFGKDSALHREVDNRMVQTLILFFEISKFLWKYFPLILFIHLSYGYTHFFARRTTSKQYGMSAPKRELTSQTFKSFTQKYHNKKPGKEKSYNDVKLNCLQLFCQLNLYQPRFLQMNSYDCGIFVMKNIELFSPRKQLMGTYSFKDIPNIRSQIANDLMFCQYNELHQMQDLVRAFISSVSYSSYNYLSTTPFRFHQKSISYTVLIFFIFLVQYINFLFVGSPEICEADVKT